MARKVQKRDRSGENFVRRWRTLRKQGLELHEKYHAEVYFLLRRNGRCYEFKSVNDKWPPAADELVSTLLTDPLLLLTGVGPLLSTAKQSYNRRHEKGVFKQ